MFVRKQKPNNYQSEGTSSSGISAWNASRNTDRGNNQYGGGSYRKSYNNDESNYYNNKASSYGSRSNYNNKGSYRSEDNYQSNKWSENSYNKESYGNKWSNQQNNNNWNNDRNSSYEDKNSKSSNGEEEEEDIMQIGKEIGEYTIGEIFDDEGKNQPRMPQSIKSYFRRIEGMIEKDEFPTADDRFQFITSVFEYAIDLKNLFDGGEDDKDELKRRGIITFVISLNYPLVAKALQKLIPVCSNNDLKSMLDACKPNFDIISQGKFSSFLLQDLLKYVPEALKEETQGGYNDMQDEESENTETTTITKILNDIYYNTIDSYLFDMIFHKNATFVVRELSKCIAYISSKEEGKTLLDVMVAKIISSCPIDDVLKDNTALGFLVALLENVSKLVEEMKQNGTTSSLFTTLIKYVMKQSEEDEFSISTETVSNLLSTPQHCRIVELLIATADDNMFAQIVENIILPNSTSFAVDKSKCYTLTHALERANREQFKSIFVSVQGSIKQCCKEGTLTVITALAKACTKFNIKKQELYNFVFGGVENLDQLVQSFLFLEEKTMNRHGCTLLSTIIDFQAKSLMAPLINYFKDMDETKFYELCISKEGSMVVDSLVKLGDQFIEKIRPKLIDLAVNIYGAFVVEKAVNDCKDYKLLKEIATELRNAESTLRSTRPGSVLWSKANLSLFKSNPTSWVERKENQRVQRKKSQKMLQEMVAVQQGENSGKKKKAKKQKEQPKEETKPVDVPMQDESPKITEEEPKKKENKDHKRQESKPEKKQDKKKEPEQSKPEDKKTEKQDKKKEPEQKAPTKERKKEHKKKESTFSLDDILNIDDKPAVEVPKKRKKEGSEVSGLIDNIFESSLKKKKV